MFLRLGQLVSRWWHVSLIAWVLLTWLVVQMSPDWADVVQDGEFVFLPASSPSRVAGRLYEEAFPGSLEERPVEEGGVQQDALGSNIVLIVRRKDGLTNQDRDFVEEVLLERLEQIARTTGAEYVLGTEQPDAPPQQDAGAEPADLPESEQIVKAIWTPKDPRVGPLLVSEDGKALLVLIELKREFLDRGNARIIQRIEQAVDDLTDLNRHPVHRYLVGLDIKISGSATVGRDMLHAEEVSGSNTEWFTKTLVIVLLLIIYRAPILAFIPLVTVGLSVEMSLRLLRIMADAGWVGLFNGIEMYVTVVVYGAGVDYCLFLIARYKEELDKGRLLEEAIAEAVHRVGIALATSAGTSICGIGMMGFAEFGKFRQAGFAISFGLAVVLCAVLTFTPALLRLFGRWAFWPEIAREQIEPEANLRPHPSLLTFLREQQWLDRGWQKVADGVEARPATVFLSSLALMLPFAVIAIINHAHLSYGLLTDLPQEDASVVGANAIQEHFPAGVGGPVTILLYSPEFDLPHGLESPGQSVALGEGIASVLTEELESRREQLKLADIRTQENPLGISPVSQAYVRQQMRGGLFGGRGAIIRNHARKTYLSQEGPLAGKVIRLDLVFDVDPFSRDSIDLLSATEQVIRDALPRALMVFDETDTSDVDAEPEGTAATETPEGLPPQDDKIRVSAHIAKLANETGIYSIGPTPSIRDLKDVTDRDQIRIDLLVVIAVYVVLVMLLRRPAISLYLIVSVVFSYLVALGVTFAVYWAWHPGQFPGLDWKVPIFLFTILIAMGEDYNILLMTRVEEEQKVHGPVKGVLVALTRTGSIISSCGIIMAGTFATLMTGTLMGMIELGFALAFGVLLDTFVVRPILVPAYLVMLHSGRFGRFGKWLGAIEDTRTSHPTTPAPSRP